MRGEGSRFTTDPWIIRITQHTQTERGGGSEVIIGATCYWLAGRSLIGVTERSMAQSNLHPYGRADGDAFREGAVLLLSHRQVF